MADTQSMPALVKALTGVLPDGAVRQLMQALGNCNQPYTSRGVQNFQAPEQLGNNNGVFFGGQWNPSDYPGLIPPAGTPGYYGIPGGGGWQGGSYTGGSYNSTNYAGNSFYFPTSQEFALNNYYGGPIMNVTGNSTFNNITANNITTQNITIVGGGGFAGFPAVPGEPQPAAPGTPGFNPVGGGASGVGIGIFLPRQPNTPGSGKERTVFVRADAEVAVPTEGTLTDDCKITLKRGRPVNVKVSIAPFTIREPG